MSSPGNISPTPTVADATRPVSEWTRAQRVELAIALRAGRLPRPEIAARLGVSVSAVSDYLTDPTGAKRRKRRQLATPPCEECRIRPTTNGRTVCGQCREWTRDLVLAKWATWTRCYGAPPTSYEWNASHARARGGEVLKRFEADSWPTATVIRRLFGGWPGLREAATCARPETLRALIDDDPRAGASGFEQSAALRSWP